MYGPLYVAPTVAPVTTARAVIAQLGGVGVVPPVPVKQKSGGQKQACISGSARVGSSSRGGSRRRSKGGGCGGKKKKRAVSASIKAKTFSGDYAQNVRVFFW